MAIENTNHSASMISISLQFVYLKLLQLVYSPYIHTVRLFYDIPCHQYAHTYSTNITTSTRKFYESSNTYAVVVLQINK